MTQPVRRIGVIGPGVVGTAVIRELLESTPHEVLAIGVSTAELMSGPVAVLSPYVPNRLRGIPKGEAASDMANSPDVIVLCTPAKAQPAEARRWIHRQTHVVAVTDDLNATRSLLGCHDEAAQHGVQLVVGAGMMPGLTCALAQLAATQLDTITEVHVAKHGTAGPACARQHHRALRSSARLLRDGAIERRAGGSGRELVWFPEPIEGADCYFAELPDPVLLARAHPSLDRASARVAANRRDRFTSWLPALLPPHAQGGIGAVRVEARGSVNGQPRTIVYGSAGRPGTIAGIVASSVADTLANGSMGQCGAGSFGVGELRTQGVILPKIRQRGVILESFEGVNRPAL